MLTSDLIRPRLRFKGTMVSVEMVDLHDEVLQRTAQELITLFRQHQHQSQKQWETALEDYEGERVDYVFIRGLAKVLADQATFTPLSTPLPPTVLREKLFAYGPVFSGTDMLHEISREGVLELTAKELGVRPEEIDGLLFADRHATYTLKQCGPEWTAQALLARYNLELARGVLYWASHIVIDVYDNYKDLWKYIKLFKLMFWAEARDDGGFRITLDGPISPFVTSTLRYGRQLAAFLPALIACERWSMHAYVRPPQARGEMMYVLDDSCSLQSHFKRSGEFDSILEADFAREFLQKMGVKRQHWLFSRESELLLLGDTVMIPDFVVTDARNTDCKILIELVGYWHPDYLRRKVEKVQTAQCPNLLLLVYKGLNVTEETFQDHPGEVLFFQNKPVIKDVIEAVERMATYFVS